MKILRILLLAMLLTPATIAGEVVDFDFDWRFLRGEDSRGMLRDRDDSDWRRVQLPHDWSIEGPFGPEHGSGNGYAPGGVGWYRKSFRLDEAHRGRRVAIEFDGVYQNSEVWINGHFVGRRPYGYISFIYDLTPHLFFGDRENVVAVRVDHSQETDSRWYTGSGIYRHVRLHIADPLRVDDWGVFVTTPSVTGRRATVHAEIEVVNGRESEERFELVTEVIDAEGRVLARANGRERLAAGASATFVREMRIDNPALWSIETPNLYTLRTRLVGGSETTIDATDTTFGVRTLEFDPDRGFLLNGKQTKLKGVCLHHDAGSLGAAVPDQVLETRLRLMKNLGANAIRTSHNPPAPELLDLCDRLGLVVQVEAFDEFTPPKNKWVEGWNSGQPSRYGYGHYFEEWAVRDVADMVRRDRNHPSVIMWSVGNEIDYANDPFSHPVLDDYRPDHPRAERMVELARPLVDTVHALDPTRPVTMALANIDMSNAVGLTELLDIAGYNYQEHYYERDRAAYPGRFIYGSENGDAYQAWAVVRDNDWVGGQFLWTGIDYLGEAGRWPSNANAAGLMDMACYMKPIGWFRKALWSEEPVVAMAVSTVQQPGQRRGGGGESEHWNWPEGANVSVNIYTNCEEVELVLNGESLGVRRGEEAQQGVLRWPVAYRPGRLVARGMNGGGTVAEFVLETAGEPARVQLNPDVRSMRANGRDVVQIGYVIVDAEGRRVPNAQHVVNFEFDGPVRLLGIGNANLSNTDPYQDASHPAWQGRGLAIFQAGRRAGEVRITARAEGLEPSTVTVEVLPAAGDGPAGRNSID